VKHQQNLITVLGGSVADILTKLHQFLISSFQLLSGQIHRHTHTDAVKNNTLLCDFAGMQGKD